MSNCTNVCRLCNNLVISTAVAFDAAANTLTITIPERVYANCEKVCIVVAQTIPTTTTIGALVNIAVGTNTFPLLKCNCAQATACEIRTRTRYATRVVTNTVSGAFKLLGKVYSCSPEVLDVLPTAATGGEG